MRRSDIKAANSCSAFSRLTPKITYNIRVISEHLKRAWFHQWVALEVAPVERARFLKQEPASPSHRHPTGTWVHRLLVVYLSFFETNHWKIFGVKMIWSKHRVVSNAHFFFLRNHLLDRWSHDTHAGVQRRSILGAVRPVSNNSGACRRNEKNYENNWSSVPLNLAHWIGHNGRKNDNIEKYENERENRPVLGHATEAINK